MTHRKQKNSLGHSENFFAAAWGFVMDLIKVIIKFPPDPDQELGDFLMEKAGAITVLIFSVFVTVAVIFGFVHGR